MRLMLGYNDRGIMTPQLLVEVDDSDMTEFRLGDTFPIEVVNGFWYGVYNIKEKSLYINFTKDTVYGVEILCDDQNRLRSKVGDYNSVFDNFHDPNYVAPEPYKKRYTELLRDYYDDSIPF